MEWYTILVVNRKIKYDNTWGTIVTPGTKLVVHLSWNVPAGIQAYSRASLVTSSPIEEGTEQTVPGRNRNLMAHHHWCGSQTAKEAVNGTDAVNTPVAYNSRSPGVGKMCWFNASPLSSDNSNVSWENLEISWENLEISWENLEIF